jgi:hypothetical protein
MRKNLLVLFWITEVIMAIALTGCWSNEPTPASIPIAEPIIQQVQPESYSKECGDGVCGLKENYANCPSECAATCGDGIVQDNENWKNCRIDLRHSCGNRICESWEHYQYCPEDCKPCIVDARGVYEGADECPPNPRWVN